MFSTTQKLCSNIASSKTITTISTGFNSSNSTSALIYSIYGGDAFYYYQGLNSGFPNFPTQFLPWFYTTGTNTTNAGFGIFGTVSTYCNNLTPPQTYYFVLLQLNSTNTSSLSQTFTPTQTSGTLSFSALSMTGLVGGLSTSLTNQSTFTISSVPTTWTTYNYFYSGITIGVPITLKFTISAYEAISLCNIRFV